MKVAVFQFPLTNTEKPPVKRKRMHAIKANHEEYANKVQLWLHMRTAMRSYVSTNAAKAVPLDKFPAVPKPCAT